MVKFVINRGTHKGRLGHIFQWGDKAVNHDTPSAMVYLKGGHIPHLTWDVAEKYIRHEQTPIFQLTMPSLADSVQVLKEFAKGAPTFCGISENSAVHLSVHDPLVEFKPGYNDNKSVAIWTPSGKMSLNVKTLREIIEVFACDSFETLFDYDLSRDSTYKRLSKAADRTQTYYEQLLEKEPKLLGSVFISLGGGFSDFYRRKCSVDVGMKARCDGFNIDLHNFISGNEVDCAELTKLLTETLEPLNPWRIRFASGPFEPKTIVLLTELGIDLFDTSFAVKMTEEGKAFQLSSTFPKNTEYITVDFNCDNKYADDFTPLFVDCDCYTCTNYTLSYLHHLNNTKELLLPVLLMIHNLNEYQKMFSLLREHLSKEKEL